MSIQSYFATSISHGALSAARRLNPQLLNEIYNLSEEDEAGIAWSEKNYAGGFTSYASANQMHKMSPTFAALEKEIRKDVIKFVKSLRLNTPLKALEMTTCWVNIMGPNSSHSAHIHPHSVVSGTYYVQMPKRASAIRFEDPRYAHFMARPPVEPKADEKFQTHVSLAARPGDLILFESWLRHEVPMNSSKEPRISISFNY